MARRILAAFLAICLMIPAAPLPSYASSEYLQQAEPPSGISTAELDELARKKQALIDAMNGPITQPSEAIDAAMIWVPPVILEEIDILPALPDLMESPKFQIDVATTPGGQPDARLAVSSDGTALFWREGRLYKGTYDGGTGLMSGEDGEGGAVKVRITQTNDGILTIASIAETRSSEGAEEWHERQFDAEGRLVTESWRSRSGDTESWGESAYTYNDAGRLVAEKSQGGTRYENGSLSFETSFLTKTYFAYDDQGRLLARVWAAEYGADGALTHHAAYALYDYEARTMTSARYTGERPALPLLDGPTTGALDGLFTVRDVTHFEDGGLTREKFTIQYASENGVWRARRVSILRRYDMILHEGIALDERMVAGEAPWYGFREHYLVVGEPDVLSGGSDDRRFQPGAAAVPPDVEVEIGRALRYTEDGRIEDLGYGLTLSRWSVKDGVWTHSVAVVDYPASDVVELDGTLYRVFLDKSGRVWLLDQSAKANVLLSTAPGSDANVLVNVWEDGRVQVVWDGRIAEGRLDPGTATLTLMASSSDYYKESWTVRFRFAPGGVAGVAGIERVTSYTGGQTYRQTYVFDDRGRVTRDEYESGDSYRGATDYRYDDAGRLIESVSSGRSSYIWNGRQYVNEWTNEQHVAYGPDGQPRLTVTVSRYAYDGRQQAWASYTLSEGKTVTSVWIQADLLELVNAAEDYLRIDERAALKTVMHYEDEARTKPWLNVTYVKKDGKFVARKAVRYGAESPGKGDVELHVWWPRTETFIVVGEPDALDGSSDDIRVAEWQQVEVGGHAYQVTFGESYGPDAEGNYLYEGFGLRFSLWEADDSGQWHERHVLVSYPDEATVTIDGVKYWIRIDENGNIALIEMTRTLSDGAVQHFDERGRLVRYEASDAMGTVIEFSYDGDAAEPSRIVRKYAQPTKGAWRIEYDAASRTAQASISDGRTERYLVPFEDGDPRMDFNGDRRTLMTWTGADGQLRSLIGMLSAVRFPAGGELEISSLRRLAESLGVAVEELADLRLVLLDPPPGVGNALSLGASVTLKDGRRFAAFLDGATVQLDLNGNVEFSVRHVLETALDTRTVQAIAGALGVDLTQLKSLSVTPLPGPAGVGNALRLGVAVTLSADVPVLRSAAAGAVVILDGSTVQLDEDQSVQWRVSRVFRTDLNVATIQAIAEALRLDITSIETLRGHGLPPPPGVGNALRLGVNVRASGKDYAVILDGATTSLQPDGSVRFSVRLVIGTSLDVRTLQKAAEAAGRDLGTLLAVHSEALPPPPGIGNAVRLGANFLWTGKVETVAVLDGSTMGLFGDTLGVDLSVSALVRTGIGVRSTMNVAAGTGTDVSKIVAIDVSAVPSTQKNRVRFHAVARQADGSKIAGLVLEGDLRVRDAQGKILLSVAKPSANSQPSIGGKGVPKPFVLKPLTKSKPLRKPAAEDDDLF